MAANANLAMIIKAQDEATAVLGKVSVELTKLGDSGSTLGTKLAGVGQALAGLAAGAAVAGVAGVAAGLGAAVKAGGDFEQQMSAIAAVSGATASELAALQTAALDLGAKTSFSAKEAAVGIEELVKAGVSIEDVLGGGAAAALDLAAAGGIAVGEAAEIASNAMNVFGLKGADMAHVADVIAGAANASAITVTDYKFALAAAGAVAATVGVGFEDLSTAIALMGNAGIKGSDAGTSLKTMLLNLANPTDKAKVAMEQLGIITKNGTNQFFTAEGKMKSLAEVSEVLRNATAGLTEQQKLMYLETIFGTDAVRAAAVMAEAGGDAFNTLAANIGKVSAQQVAATRLNNLWGALEQLKGSAETAAIAVGLKLMPGLTRLTQWATTQLNAAIPSLEAFAAGLVAVVEQASAAIGDLMAAFQGEGGGAAAADVLSTLFPPNVVAAVIDGVRQLGDAWRTVMQVFGEGWEPSAVVDPFVNAVGSLALVLRDQVIPAVRDVSAFIVQQFGTVVSWFSDNWPLIAETNQTVVGALTKEWGQTGASLPNIVRVAWEAIKTILSTELGAVLGLTRAQLQLLNGDWQGAWQTLYGVVQTTSRAIEDLLFMFFGGTVQALNEWAAAQIAALTAWGEQLPIVVTTSIAAVGAVMAEGWATIQGAMATILAAILASVQAVWTQIPEDIRADLVLIANHLVEQGAVWLANVVQAGQGIVQAVSAWLAETVAAVTTWAQDTFLRPIQALTTSASQEASAVGGGMLASITAKLAEAVTAMRTWAGSTFLEPLRQLASTAESAARSIGTAIVQGIISGVRAMGSTLGSVLAAIVRDALDRAKQAIGANSPSKLFADQVGKPIGQGIASGIEAMRALVSDATSALVMPSPVLAAAAQVAPVPLGTPLAAGMAAGGPTVNVYVYGHALANERDIADVVLTGLRSLQQDNRTRLKVV